uniref:E3 ubiquitin-protein ligase PPP1R11 n=1 Tax=Oryctolagus cuniculus TaxID=9986 RepID=A0A5F9DT77_RABIT
MDGASTCPSFQSDLDFCPDCGSVLPLPGAQDTVVCTRCGFSIHVRDFEGKVVQTSFVFHKLGAAVPASAEEGPEFQGPVENRSLTIKLRKRKPEKKVEWTSDTVDNEHMGRRSSKCCCIYEKPRAFGESSTESDEEEDEGCGHTHCVRGHRRGRRHAALGPTPSTPPQPPDPSQPPPGPMQH